MFGLLILTGVSLSVPRIADSAIQEGTGSEGTLALVGARIYVSPFQNAIDNGVVVIRDGKIAAVGHRGKVHIAQGTGMLDCSGMFITAGFQNSHVHFTEPKWENAAQSPADQLASQLRDMFTRY